MSAQEEDSCHAWTRIFAANVVQSKGTSKPAAPGHGALPLGVWLENMDQANPWCVSRLLQ